MSRFLGILTLRKFTFITNDIDSSVINVVVISYEKRGNADIYIKEVKYDMAVGGRPPSTKILPGK